MLPLLRFHATRLRHYVILELILAIVIHRLSLPYIGLHSTAVIEYFHANIIDDMLS